MATVVAAQEHKNRMPPPPPPHPHPHPQASASAAPSQNPSWEIPDLPADSSFINGVASRDVVLSKSSSDVYVRLFLPESALASAAAESSRKLPILVHVHGGGFVRFSAATASYHDFCKKVAIDAGVLVVSLNHRLAPTFPLPAAYHDLVEALHWLRIQARQDHDDHEQVLASKDPWMVTYADFSSVIFMGGSSGGNIVHNTLLSIQHQDFLPLKFLGQILLQPFFGGNHRTKSELRLCEGPILTLPMSDMLWQMALPQGADRSHEFCDPVVSANLPKTLVVTGGRDLLHDRQVEYASALKQAGVNAKLVEFPDATHGFVTSEGSVSYIFMSEVLQFIRWLISDEL